MPLQPLADVTQQPDQGDAAAARQPTFRERKTEQLQGETQPQPGRREDLAESDDPEMGYPDESLDSLDDEGHDSDVESDEPGALTESTPDQDDDTADAEDDTELSYEDLQAKYKSAVQEISRVTANRKKIEQDFSDGIADNIKYRHQLEDLNAQAEQRAQFFLGLANQQVQTLENADWSQVPPEKMAAAKQRYQKAVHERDQLVQVFQATQRQAHEALEQVKKREAEIARNQLHTRIPQWNDEHYGRLREHAVTLGWSTDEYNDLTDWRIIELIHRNWEANQAVEKVQNVKRKRQARAPRNRNGRPQPRNADGRYRKSRDDAFERPGDKGSFREMKMRQMERERNAGR